MKVIKTVQYKQSQIIDTQPQNIQQQNAPIQPQQPQNVQPQNVQAPINFNYLNSFAINLRTSVNNFVSNIAKYQSPEQPLLELENIQTILEKIIASVQGGVRKPVVTNPQAVQQAKTPLVQ